MPTLTDMNEAPCSSGVPLPAKPFVALHPHYGMLLGVADFQADQAYHRGKMRLHNAWAHGWGVLWGLGVSIDLSKGEVAVAPGLALDGRGRELHNDGAMCVNVARWFEAHRNDAGFVFTDTAGVITFDAHVRIRHHACLSAPVPALADSCSNDSAGVAYSRVFETVLIELVPGPAPARSHRNPVLRVLAGLQPARQDDAGGVLPSDQAALDARAAISAAAPADRVAAAAAALHHLSVIDSIAEGTAQAADPDDPDDTDDSDGQLFPAAGPDSLALADLTGVTLTPKVGGTDSSIDANTDTTSATLSVAAINLDVRSVLLASATLQALGGALLAALA